MLPCGGEASEKQLWRFQDAVGEERSSATNVWRLVHAATGKCLDLLVGMARHNKTAFVQRCRSRGEIEEEEDEEWETELRAQLWRFDTEHPYKDIS